MNIDEIIEAHQEAISRLQELKTNLLTATDGAISVKEVLARLSTEREAHLELHITCSKKEQPEVEWQVWRGNSWDKKGAGKGPTLADAYRKFAHPDGDATIETVAAELQG